MEQKNTLMGVLCYLGPLVIVSLLAAKGDMFVKYHVKQGLVLFIIEVVVWFLGMYFWPLWMFLQLVNLGVFILAIIGIVNVVNGEEKPLPLVGSLAEGFKF